MAKFALIIFIFLIGASVAGAASGNVTQFVFTSDPQTIKPNEISQKITIQAQSAEGGLASIPQTACLELKTTSGSGEFSSSDSNWNSVEILTMSKGSANRNFYYKDQTEGAYDLSVNISLRPEDEKSSCASWLKEEWDIKWNAKQNIVVSSSQNEPQVLPSEENDNNNQQLSGTEPNDESFWPVEEQIFANAGEDKIISVGADAVFSGKALGLKKEPLENARYLWNFGDGAMAEGENVRHFYKYPGKYIMVLNVSSGKYSAADRVVVQVIPNELKISEANGEFIKLRNGSKYILDISSWFLRKKGNREAFKFPDSSLISAGADLTISSDISKIKLGKNNSVELLYPNGSVAFVYEGSQTAQIQTQAPPQPVQHPISNTKEKKDLAATQQPKNTDVQDVQHPMLSIVATTTTNSSAQEDQLASVIAIADKKDFMAGKWIFLIIPLALFASAGLFLIRRYGGA